MKIKRIQARPVSAPIRRPPQTASGAITHAALVLIDLETDEGITGRAYLFAFMPAMLNPTAQCVEAVGQFTVGENVAPLTLDAKLRRRVTLLDTHGILGQALAGIDMAAWDALAQSRELPLARMLGGELRLIRAYNSCGLWIQDPSTLADEAEALLLEGGYDALKIRLGRTDVKGDLDAVRRVRERIGDRVLLMSDFNQSLNVEQAIQRCRALDDEGLYWFEEPVRHDDFEGCRRISTSVATPIQIGENLRSCFEMQSAMDAGAARYYMPDVQRIGGVSGWLRASALAEVRGFDLSSHLFPEISAHLLAVTPTRHWLEYMDWAAPVLRRPLEIRDGMAVVPDRPGVGLEWDEDAVSRFAFQ